MANFTVEKMQADPIFDLELLMSTSQETRIGGEAMDALSDAWDAWASHAHAVKITADNNSYLLVWLDEFVENAVDDKWEETPSDAFLYNSLAQVMCMGLVHAIVPEVEYAGCAAAPAPTAALEEALASEGVPYLEEDGPGLARRYAVVTHYPFKGGCEICYLQPQCPKGGEAVCDSDGPTSVTLPGFEQ